jgi:hypothetical protein
METTRKQKSNEQESTTEEKGTKSSENDSKQKRPQNEVGIKQKEKWK